VLNALADEPSTWRYGYELGQQVDLRAGSLYPILMRLTDRGLLESTWEAEPPAGRPPRHLYRLTKPGRELAAEITADQSSPAVARSLPLPSRAQRPAEFGGAW
jgi:DNA-binding PadR family transcriptional regulator